MLLQLFYSNFHFGINVFEALVFFITGWLYFDSWKIAKNTKSDLVRSIGLFCLAGVAMVHASLVAIPSVTFSFQLIKIIALFLIAGSLVAKPVLSAPKTKVAMFFPFILLTNSLIPLSAVLFFWIALLYLRTTTEGLSKQNKPVFIAFLLLSLAEIVNVTFFTFDTSIVVWSKLLAQYGLIWNISHLLELAGVIVLGLWTWKYLRFKADFQLFLTAVSSSLFVFIIMTTTFTFLLLRNLETNISAQLKTNVEVMQYALERLKMQASANAQTIANNSSVVSAFLQDEDEKLFDLSSKLMLNQETSFLTIASSSGKVVMRAEDKEKKGDSVLENSIFQSAINGTPQVTIEVKEGALTPSLEILAADSFSNNLGVVITGFSIDNAFVDGVKAVTGLDTSVYSDNLRVATTFIAPDDKSRFIGIEEANEDIISTVLEKGEIYTGPAKILNQSYYTAFTPIKNAENKIIGMLFVGKPQKELFETAQKSTQLTFMVSAFLILLSIAPAYYLSQHIKENIKA